MTNRENIKMNPGDRWEGNGMYCGECGEVKYRRLDGGIYKRQYCKCELTHVEAEKRRVEAETALLQRKTNKLECFSGFDRFKSYTFETVFPEIDHLEVAKKYVSEFNCDLSKNFGLLFFGAPGFGKTCMAACVANGLIDRGFTVKILSTMSVMYNLYRSDDKQDLLRRLNGFDLLVLDDFGVEGEHYANMMYMLLESRSNAGKPIIITTNLTSEALQRPDSQIRKRIYDRALLMCPFPMEFKTKNLRRMETVLKNKEMRVSLELGDRRA